MKKDLKKGEKLAKQAILLESFLAGAKVAVGVLSGSMVLFSDAIHSLSDVSSIIISWLGLKIAQRDPNKKFPYGYYKAENLGALAISLFILYAGGQMMLSAWHRLFQFPSLHLPYLALTLSLLDGLILFLFGNYEVKIGREVGAESLAAMGRENRTHLLSSSAVFLGILATIYKIPYIESIIILAIAFLILEIGFETARGALLSLMDVSPGEEIEKKAGEAVESAPGVEGFYDLRLRRAGPFVFGEVKVGVRKLIDVGQAHQIADDIERRVKKKIPQIDSFIVHIEPFESNFHHLVIPVLSKNGLEAEISPHLAHAPYLLFVNLEGNRLRSFYVLKNPYQKRKVRAGLAVAKLIVKQKSDVLIVRQVGEIALHALRDNLLDIYRTRVKLARQAVEKFSRGELKEIKMAKKSGEIIGIPLFF